MTRSHGVASGVEWFNVGKLAGRYRLLRRLGLKRRIALWRILAWH